MPFALDESESVVAPGRRAATRPQERRCEWAYSVELAPFNLSSIFMYVHNWVGRCLDGISSLNHETKSCLFLCDNLFNISCIHPIADQLRRPRKNLALIVNSFPPPFSILSSNGRHSDRSWLDAPARKAWNIWPSLPLHVYYLLVFMDVISS
jgi:hypothetical protein